MAMDCCPRKNGMSCLKDVQGKTYTCEYHQTQMRTGYWQLHRQSLREGEPENVTVEPPYRSLVPDIMPEVDEWSVTYWPRPNQNTDVCAPVRWLCPDEETAHYLALDVIAGNQRGGQRLQPSVPEYGGPMVYASLGVEQ